MKFEIGKYYKHTTGIMLHVLCEAETMMYGKAMIAEEFGTHNDLVAVGDSEENAVNFIEVTKKEWMKAWDSIDHKEI